MTKHWRTTPNDTEWKGNGGKMAYIETMKVKVMRMPCTGRDERTAFEWMLSRYTESGSDEDLADIERIAEYNRHAAYWLHRRAVECFLIAAEHGSGEALRWLDFLTEPPSIDDPEPPTFRWRGISEDYPVPGYFHRSHEWLVLKAVTGERLRSDYPMLSNASGGFENDVFAIFPDDIVVEGSSGVTEWTSCLVFKPTGFRISWDRDPDRDADMSQDISWDDLARILRLCIASACDSIREVDA